MTREDAYDRFRNHEYVGYTVSIDDKNNIIKHPFVAKNKSELIKITAPIKIVDYFIYDCEEKQETTPYNAIRNRR